MLDTITSNRIVMNRTWAMPSADTLSIPPIRQLVKKYLHDAKVSVDPFARNCTWATYTNDLNPDTAAEYHLDAGEFLRTLINKGVRAQAVIFDPPYSLQQAKQVYQNVGRKFLLEDAQQVGRWSAEKEVIAKLLKPRGVCMSFGWHSNAMGEKRGFEIVEILLVAHGSAHNDTICTVERKLATPPTLFEGKG